MAKKEKGKREYGNNDKIPEDTTRCIVGIWSGFAHHQCSRRRGYGKKGLYCKQHDPERIKAKEDAYYKKIQAALQRKQTQFNRVKLLLKMADGLTITDLKKCHITFKKEYKSHGKIRKRK